MDRDSITAGTPGRGLSTEPILRVEGLVKQFPLKAEILELGKSPTVKAVDDVSFSLAAGETLAIVGESGCGKSTLGRLLLRLIEPTSGRVYFQGQNIFALGGKAMRALRRSMQIIFQDPFAALNPRMTVGAILSEPLRLHSLARPRERRARVDELLHLVGLAPYHANRYPHEFSGGQRQRIGIARALAVNPKLIIGDEPVSALDVSIQAQIINLLQDLQDRFGLSYIIIAHDLAVVKHIADRVAVIYLGKIVELAETKRLFAEPRHPYTQALLSAIPIPDPARKRRPILLQGDVPSPANPPPGCHLHTRCPHARARCRVEAPELRDDGAGHMVACHFWSEIPPVENLIANRGSGAPPPHHARLEALVRRYNATRAPPSSGGAR